MKTKAEILEEFGCPTPDYTETVTMFYPSINDAMDEYAKQRAQEFAEWIDKNGYYISVTTGLWVSVLGGDKHMQLTTAELYAKFEEERGQE